MTPKPPPVKSPRPHYPARMHALGHGIDLVEVARIERMLADHPDRFAERCFTPAEREYCSRSPQRAGEHYAARFAAKEAVLKALGRGLGEGLSLNEIEVTRSPGGEPALLLHAGAGAIARSRGVSRWLISLSHTRTHAIASVIALGDG
jgi:holo-[acyl-carrier protein] synthase